MEYILFGSIIVILIGLYIRKKKTRIKNFGERIVERELNKLQDDEHFIINDVLLMTEKGYSQIDHLIISVYGLTVVETKDYFGWIYGNEESEYWTQKIYYEKHEFRNPIKQNWSHIYALKEVLWGFDNITYYPIIVFVGDAELKGIKTRTPVVYLNQLNDVIRRNEITPNISLRQVHQIVDEIHKLKFSDYETKQKQINYVHDIVEEKERKIDQLVCPKCGGRLIVKDGKYGKFYGCSSFPKCKYTLSI
jgi:hypothetical protein